MDVSRIKLIAFDLDGTLTQHKTPLCSEHRAVLDMLGKRYRLLMAGAGMCERIFMQMDEYPIDIFGNYGMQFAEYDPAVRDLVVRENHFSPCDRDSIEMQVTALREKYGYPIQLPLSQSKRLQLMKSCSLLVVFVPKAHRFFRNKTCE